MARDIDLSKPLSDEDRAWLISRNRHDLISIADSSHSAPQGVAQAGAVGQADLHRLQAFLQKHFPDDASSEPSTAAAEGPVDVAIRLLSERVDIAEAPEVEAVNDGTTPQDLGETGSEGGYPEAPATAGDDYESLTVPDLKDELEKRELSRSGTKDELIARLREDDEA